MKNKARRKKREGKGYRVNSTGVSEWLPQKGGGRICCLGDNETGKNLLNIRKNLKGGGGWACPKVHIKQVIGGLSRRKNDRPPWPIAKPGKRVGGGAIFQEKRKLEQEKGRINLSKTKKEVLRECSQPKGARGIPSS